MKQTCVEVFLGARSIGIVAPAGSALLRAKTDIAQSVGRALRACVVDEPSFMGTFIIELI